MKKGFTLIELLVVMFIIAILASLVIVNVNGSRKTARDSKRIANLKAIQGALEQYGNKNGKYPMTFSASDPGGWTACSGYGYCLPSSVSGWTGMCSYWNPTGTSTTSGTTGWIPGLAPEFISVLPRDPKEGNSSCYIYRSNGTDYTVLAYQTMETVCDGTLAEEGTYYSGGQMIKTVTDNSTADPGDTCNPTSIQEMDRQNGEYNSIAVFSSGAWNW